MYTRGRRLKHDFYNEELEIKGNTIKTGKMSMKKRQNYTGTSQSSRLGQSGYPDPISVGFKDCTREILIGIYSSEESPIFEFLNIVNFRFKTLNNLLIVILLLVVTNC